MCSVEKMCAVGQKHKLKTIIRSRITILKIENSFVQDKFQLDVRSQHYFYTAALLYYEHCVRWHQGNDNSSIACGPCIEYVQHVAQRSKQTGSEGEHRGHLTVNK